jgi:cytochrome c oxidase cbb3-type subunit III
MNENQKEHTHHDHEEIDDVTKIKYYGGHEYDGIKELDNPLPPWLKYLFYVTIVLSVAYITALVVFKNESLVQRAEYSNEMKAARAKTEDANKTEGTQAAAAPVSREQILADGKSTFDKICSVCHGKFGEGLVGPNFTDDYWIHGGKPEELLVIINNGVLEKGMLAYKSQLSKKKINNVIEYILSLQGTNPPNQKAPEGQKVVKN